MDSARATAAEIDRLVISVHLTARDRHGYEVWDQATAAGLESIFLLNDVAEFLLSGRLTEPWLLRRFRYMEEADVAEGLDALRDGGHIVMADDGYQAVPRLAGFLDWLLAMRAEAAAELWSTPADVADLDGAVTAVVATFPSEGFPLAADHRSLPDPHQPALRLHHHLTTLRYCRADAHGDAWAAEGMTASQAAALTTLWKGGSLAGDDGAGLAEAGWAMPDPWRITPAGVEIRDRIEVETDQRNNRAFASLSPDEVMRLVELMARLPGGAQS